jgi:hypothetical protein
MKSFKYLMLIDLNLSEMPHLKEYNGLFFEVFLGLDAANLKDNYVFKELIDAFKLFAKLSLNQIFFDLGFSMLKTYMKRCKFGFCDIFFLLDAKKLEIDLEIIGSIIFILFPSLL